VSLQDRLASLITAIGADIKGLTARSPAGVPILWLPTSIPTGYLEFNGQAITVGAYPKLFAVYGAALPDLRGRFLLSADAARVAGTLSQSSNAANPNYAPETVTLTAAQTGVPAHGHADTLAAPAHTHPSLSGGNTFVADIAGGLYLGASGARQGGVQAANTGAASATALAGAVTNHAGTAATAHSNLPPFIAARWITYGE
jgi:hypothetical protein